jgi:ATP-dependent DNA helicase RecQ
MSSGASDRLQEVLQAVWGYPDFRPLQRPIAESVVSGHDTVALLPTGGGKSLCFQVPGLALGGTTIVISPLISLMSDQVAQLVRRGIDARSLAGDLKNSDWMDLQRRPPQFAYVSPERARSRNFTAIIEHWDVRLLAIDEAHCVSQWGHDFRPQYTQLKDLRDSLSHVPCIALTASATPDVLADVIHLLGLREPQVFQASFARPNIVWTVREVSDLTTACAESIVPYDGRQIVYVRSRAAATRWAQHLSDRGIPAAPYHAGMPHSDRERLQTDWSQGIVRTMVATTAFGMGIDQPDVRQVLHTELPESPEALYQEIGRGGRDGHDAQALVLLEPKALAAFTRKMERSMPAFTAWIDHYHALASTAQIAVGDGQGVRVRPQTPIQELVLRIMARKGLVEVIEESEAQLRVRLRHGGSELVDVAETNPAYSDLLYTLARRYPGIVHHSERIELSILAGIGGWTLAQVRLLLHRAAELELLSLEGGGQGTTYRWAHPRVPQGSSPIVRSEWDTDRNRILSRSRAVAAMLDPDSVVCRFTQLLAYFGEQADDCGRCDVCRARREPSERAYALLTALHSTESGRLSIRDAAEHTGLSRSDAARFIGRGANLGWWTLDESGWVTL